MAIKFIPVIEEQMSVGFTGKVNILSPFNHQFLGFLLFKDGQVINTKYQNKEGLRAFYHLGIREHCLDKHQYIVEPEIVNEDEKRIHFPFTVLKSKLDQQIKIAEEVQKFRPPQHLRIVVDPRIISKDFECTPEEFKVLGTLTEWNKVEDIYEHCSLLEHEITNALVILRKKGALKIIGVK